MKKMKMELKNAMVESHPNNCRNTNVTVTRELPIQNSSNLTTDIMTFIHDST
jgi:hypothetical protein